MSSVIRKVLSKPTTGIRPFCILLVAGCGLPFEILAANTDDLIELRLQTRDVSTGQPIINPTQLDLTRTGVVIIDMWNWHWCKTATERVASMVPRMERCLIAARRLGMQIFFCPTDAVDAYVGTPQRERIFAMPMLKLPTPATIDCPAPPQGPGCACGPEKCKGNYGWDAMHPALSIHADDLMPNSFQSLYSICKNRGIENLIYLGVHTQVCLLGKSVGLKNMKSVGFNCILARDLTDSHPDFDPARGIDPDDLTARTVAHFEKYLCSTINFQEELQRLNLWHDSSPVDPVRLTPWGTPTRPHLFEKPITLLLTTPWQPAANIHFTTDGSDPSPQSPLYNGPLIVDHTLRIRAQAFDGDRPVSTETIGYFALLADRPPVPDLYLTELKPLRAAGPGHSPSDDRHRFSANAKPPQPNSSNEGKTLRLRGRDYERGVGVRAPNHMIFEMDQNYDRFVALAGVDEHLLDTSHGSNLAKHPSVIFRVYIDGREVATSPVMRISFEPWRFDVKIPPGSRVISLCATDAGDGPRQDLANWVEAGFILRDTPDCR